MERPVLKDKKRIVIKVGTSTLTYPNGKVNLNRIDKLARVLSDLKNMGKDVILISSGAIGVGMGKLKIDERPHNTAERQAIAAVGQCELMQMYSKFFSEYGQIVGQILLTRDVVDNDYSRTNVVNTFEKLLEKGIIPIVNENDSVSIEELKSDHNNGFGDNDRLSAIVSTLIEADILIILTDIDGFYTKDPRNTPDAKPVRFISAITEDIEKSAGGVGSSRGTGGMITKIAAARIVLDNGIGMVLVNGQDPAVIYDVFEGREVGTYFFDIH